MDKKQLMLASAALAAVLLTGAQTASADEIKNGSDSVGQSTDSVDQLAKAQQQVQTAQNNVEQAQTSVNSVQNALSSAQAVQSQAQQTVDQAQVDANTAQSAVNEAQTAVDAGKAQADQKAQDTTAIKQRVVADQATADSAQGAVNAAQIALNGVASQEDQKAISSAEQATSQAQASVDQAQVAYSQASQASQTAQTNADQLKQTLENTPEYVTASNDEYQGFTINDAAKQAASAFLTAWQNGASNAELTAAKEALFKALDTNMPSDDDLMDPSKTLNKYQYSQSPELKNELISNDGLTDEQTTRLAEYAVYLVNQVRDELGFTPYVGHVVPTMGMMELTKQVMNGYVADNWNITIKKAHDNTAINKAAMQYGVAYPADNSGQYIEDADSEAYPSQQLTMNDLFGLVFSNMRTFFFNDGGTPNYGHTISLLAMDYMNSFKQMAQKVSYLGFAYNPMSNGNVQDLNTHYLIVPDLAVMITNDATFNVKNGRTAIENKTLNPAYESAKQGYNTALQKLAEAQSAEASAQTALNKAQIKLAQEQADLDTAHQKSTADATQTAELTQKLNATKDDLAKAQAQLANDQKTLEQINDANAKIKTAQEQQTAREQKLAATKAVLASAQASLQTATQKLADAKAQTAAKEEVLAKAQASLQTAQQQLTTAKARLTALETIASAEPVAPTRTDDSAKDQSTESTDHQTDSSAPANSADETQTKDSSSTTDSAKDQAKDSNQTADSVKDQTKDSNPTADSTKDQADDPINQPSIDVVKDQDLKPISYPTIDAVEDIVSDNDNDSAKDLTDDNDSIKDNDSVKYSTDDNDHADYQSKDISNHINNDSYQDINSQSSNANTDNLEPVRADSTALPQTGNDHSENVSVIGLLGMVLAGLAGVSTKRRRMD